MTGPSTKRASIRQGIYDLLSAVEIDTKELGRCHVEPWLSQRLVIDAVSKGLSEDVHEFVILKCRQVAVTTTCSVIELFWALANAGTQGAIIADRTDNLERLRRIFAALLETLPSEWRSREHRLTVNNRNGMRFANNSVLDLLAAASNPDLGASRALNLAHCTECGTWKSLAGVESLKASLARQNPSRLYMWESIANGFNWWYQYCQQAKQDKHMRFIFIGFWAQPNYSIPQNDPDFKTYWDGRLTETELKDARYVKQQYGYTIKAEQIAWWRREAEFKQEEYMWRHYPFHERQCFIASGRGWFPAARTLAMAEALSPHGVPYQGYTYKFEEEFLGSSIQQIKRNDDREDIMLRVWEHPVPEGVYVIGADPSGGGSGESDDHAIEVFRCYADRLVQVAEFQSNRPLTYQMAWVLCHLAGAYRDHMANLEVTGIGAAVQPEVSRLRRLAERAILAPEPGKGPILDMIGSVRWFLYARADSMSGPGNIRNWKTNADNKLMIFSEFRDSLMVTKNELEIRSVQLVEQMQGTVEEDGWIGAGPDTGVNDDLVCATALAIHTWVAFKREPMIAANMTWKSQHEKPPSKPADMLNYAFSEHWAKMNRKAGPKPEAF